MSNVKIIFSLIKLNKNILFNSFKKTDTWLKIITIVLIVYMLYNSIISGGLSATVFRSIIHPGDIYYFPAVNIGILILFVLNIISPIFISSSKYFEKVGAKLIYYPISINKIVLFGITTTILDLYNLLFVPFYAATFIVIDSINSFTGLILSLIIFFLFILLTGSLIYLLKNLYMLIVTNQKQKKIFTYIGAATLILIFIYSGGSKGLLEKAQNIIVISKAIIYLPSGILANFITHTPNKLLNNFAMAFIYFLLLNVLLYYSNIRVQKKLKGTIRFSSVKNSLTRESGLIPFVRKSAINPVIKKDIIYSIRSPRELLNNMIMIGVLLFLLCFVIQKEITSRTTGIDLISALNFFILFHTIILIKYGGNFFGYDYSGVINYFSKPLKYIDLIDYKSNSFKYYVFFNFIIASVCLTMLKISGIDYLLYTCFTIFTYLLFKPICTVLSLNFPYMLNFYGLTGMNFSFIALIFIVILEVALMFISFLLFNDLNPFYKVVISSVLLIVSYLLFISKKRINSFLANILLNKKEKIISTCS